MCESLLYSTVFKTIMLLGAFMLSELDSGYIKLPYVIQRKLYQRLEGCVFFPGEFDCIHERLLCDIWRVD